MTDFCQACLLLLLSALLYAMAAAYSYSLLACLVLLLSALLCAMAAAYSYSLLSDSQEQARAQIHSYVLYNNHQMINILDFVYNICLQSWLMEPVEYINIRQMLHTCKKDPKTETLFANKLPQLLQAKEKLLLAGRTYVPREFNLKVSIYWSLLA